MLKLLSRLTRSFRPAGAASALPPRPLAEKLEPRLLYSADLMPVGLGADAALPGAETRVLDSDTSTWLDRATAQQSGGELLIIDGAVDDADTLLNELRAANPALEVVQLDSSRDGIEQIGQGLATRTNLGAVHILSHGAAGELQLGNGMLDQRTLDEQADRIAAWGRALGADADILLYGCDVAASSAGEAFVENLAALTGADVAASTDLTGTAALGGNWTLEVQTGRIEAGLATSTALQSQWTGLLAVYNANASAADGAVNSLRWAITQANGNAGVDTINLAAGTYTLTLAGNNDNDNLSGDLDILEGVQIVGASAKTTFVDGSELDRIFDVRSGATTLSGVTLRGGGNTQNSDGGAIYVQSGAALTVFDSALKNNAAAHNGGAIYNKGWISLARVTFENNTSTDGAGMFVNSDDGSSLSNVTFSGNIASDEGGALNTNGATSLTNVTIAGNSAASNKGGAIFKSGSGTTTLLNTILANNTGGNVSGSVVSLGNNIDSGNTALLSGPGDQINTDPLLGGLLDNGGSVETMALLSGSPAVNAGTATAAPTTDARGASRLGATDIGAYESTLIAYEPFAYASGSFNGASGGTGWSGGWGNAGTKTTIVASGLESPGGTMLVTGGAAQLSMGLLDFVEQERLLGTTLGADNTTAWLSFLLKPGGSMGIGEYAGLEIGTNGSSVFAGYNGSNFIIDNAGGGGTATVPGLSAVAGQTYLLTLKLSFNGGSDSITLYVDPSLGQDGPLTSYSASKFDRDLGSFNRIAFNGNRIVAANSSTVDEIRLAGSFVDATPGVASTQTAPVITTSVTSLNFVEGAGATAVDPALTVSDVDSGSLTGATVAITGNYASGQDVLAFTNQLGITGSWNATTGVLTLSGTATVADYQAALRTVSYHNTSDNPSTSARTVSFVVNDGTATSVAASRTVTVTPVADHLLTVDTTNDVVDGVTTSIDALLANRGPDGFISLREAITAANNTAGTDTIVLPSGSYALTKTGSSEDFNVRGDLDVRDSLIISGAGASTTTVSAGNLSGVFQVVSGTLTLSGVTIRDGAASNGAGVQVNDGTTLALSESVVRDNAATQGGGGLGLAGTGATITLDRVQVLDNTARYGGGVYIYQGSLVATDSTVEGNTSTQWAGGIYVERGTGVLNRVTVSNNNAGSEGGGIMLDVSATLSVTNATISGNGSAAAGGGIYVWSGVLSVTASTIANNTAPSGAGIGLGGGGSASLSSTIVAGNTGSSNANSALTSLGYNLDSGNSLGLNQVSDLVNSDPLLAPLADNGGYTKTHALSGVSPARNKGDPGAPATDQRGTARLGAPDIGAYEYSASNVAPNVIGSGGTLAYSENDPATAVAPALTVTDSDSANLTGATVTVSANYANGEDVLAFTDQLGITGTWSAATGVLTLSGSATVANYQAALRSVTYVNTSDAPSMDTRTVSFAVNDGLAGSNTATRSISVATTNDAPQATNLSAAESYTEDTPLNLTDIVISDVDSATVTATLTLSVPGAGSLNTASAGAVTSTYDAGTGVWSASGAIADLNTLLAGLTFTPTADYNANFSIATSVGDGVAAPVTGSKAFTGTAVNDAPVIAGGANAAFSVPENTTAVTTVVASDTEGTAPVYSISGGDDAGRFTIDSGSGALAFASAPSFETPTDVGTNNVYNVIVRASDGSLWSEQVIAVTVTDVLGAPGAATANLLFTTAGNQTSAAGGITWNAGQVLQYGNVGDRFDIDGGLTTGTVELLPGFVAPAPVRAMHYVQTAISIGTGTGKFNLNPGDLLLVLDPGGAPATLSLNAGALIVERQDIVVFRPTTAGNYAAGTYSMLLDDGVKDGATTYNVHGLSLVETTTTIGGITLPVGTFLVAHSDKSIHNNVYTFTASSTGQATTVTGSLTKLLDGSKFGLNPNGDKIMGLHLLSGPTAFNDSVLGEGTLLVAIDGATSNTIGGVTEDALDIMALTFSQTELNGVTALATGGSKLLFDGSDLGLTKAGSTNLNGFTVVTGTVTNSAPTVANAIADQAATEDLAFSYTVPAGTFTDPDAGDTLTYSATLTGGGALPSWLSFNPATRQFTGTPLNDDVGTINLRVTATDGAGAKATSDFMLTVANVNDAPQATNLSAAEAYTEDTPLNLTDIVISDVDSATVTATLTLSVPGAGSLNTATSGAVTSTYDAGTGVWSASGAIADLNTLLAGLTFTPTADYNASFSIATSVGDGVAAPVTGSKAFTGTAVNDAPTFNTDHSGDGIATWDGGGADGARAVTVQSDGKILVAGYTYNGSDNDFLLQRYNADGTRDSSFGGGDGIVITDFGGTSDVARAVEVQSDGKIVVSGTSKGDFAVARYNGDGSADTGFGTGGLVTTDLFSGTDESYGLVIQADGKILLSGHATGAPGGTDFALVRYNANGTLDTGFGTNGIVAADFAAGGADYGYNVVVQSDGKIVMGGYGPAAGGGNDVFTVARFNANGSVDTSFGGGTGYAVADTDGPGSRDVGFGIALQADGKIVQTGFQNATRDIVVVRWDSSGMLDSTFGGVGYVSTDLGGAGFQAYGYDITVQPDGKLLVSGYHKNIGSVVLALRYNTDGSLDTGFGSGGIVTTSVNGVSDIAYSAALQSDGGIILVGTSSNGSNNDLAVIRYTSGGTLDTRFDGVNTLNGAPTYVENGAAVVLDSDVRILDPDLVGANYAGATLTLARSGGASAEDVFGNSGLLSALTESGNLVVSGTTIGMVTSNSSGTLMLTFNGNATQALVNAALQALTYANNSDSPPASVQINWTFNDGNTGAQGTGGALSATGSTTVGITAVNDAPVASNLGAAESYTEDSPLDLTDIAISDVDSATVTATLTLSVPGAGSLNTATSGAVTSTYDAGTGVWSASGAIADVNTLLAGLTFTPTADYNASFNIATSVSDGVAAPLTGSKNVTGTAVNDAPQASGSAVLAAVNEDTVSPGGATVASLFFANFSDPTDAGNPAQNQFAGVAVRGQAVDLAEGRWQYSIDGGANWSNFGFISDTKAVALRATDFLRFQPATNYNGTPNSLSVRLIDNSTTVTSGAMLNVAGFGASTPYSAAVVSAATSVIAVNDAPAGANRTVTVLEDASYTFTAADFGFSDSSDSPANALLAVKITTLPGAGTLRLDGAAVSAGDFVSTADIAAGKLRFAPAANANGAGYAGFSFQVRDNGGTANGGVDLDATPNTITIDVTSLNDAPVLTPTGSASYALDENSGVPVGAVGVSVNTLVSLAGSGSGPQNVSDPDGGALTGIAINGADSTNGTWYWSLDNGASWNPLGGVSNTSARLLTSEAGMRVAFAPHAGYSGTTPALSFKAWDRSAWANGAQQDTTVGSAFSSASDTLTVVVGPANRAPTVVAVDLGSTAEDASRSITRAELLGGAGDADGDALGISNVLLAAGNGTIVDNGNGTWTFTPTANWNGAVSFGFDVDDGKVSVSNTASLVVSAVNDAPAGADRTVTVLEDGSYTFATADFGFSDPSDSPANTLLAVKIGALPGAGALRLDGAAVSAGEFVSAADIAAGKLRFAPAANANGAGYASFTFQVRDNGGIADGGIDLDPTPNTLTIDVTSVNDAPAGANRTVTVLEDASYTFNTADFGFSDPSDSPASALLAVKIGALPGAGTLRLDGAAVSAGEFVSAADIAAGKLRFAPAANANGAGYASFSFQVRDNGGIADGGIDLDPTPNTLTIDVTAVNDAPEIAINTLTIAEGATVTLDNTMLHATDVESGPAALSYSVSGLGGGFFALATAPTVAISSFTQAQVDAGNVIFTHDGNEAAPSYTLTVTDSSGTPSAPSAATISYARVNDAPMGTSRTISLLEDGRHTFVAADFGFSDPDDSPSNALLAIRISSLPSAGSLRLDGRSIAVGEFVGIAELTQGKLSFSPAANANGSAYASFGFQVRDDGGVANGGVDLDPTIRTISFDVGAVNDAPTLSGPGRQIVRSGEGFGPLVLNLGDEETEASDLSVRAYSTNQAVLPDSAIQLSGAGAERSLTVQAGYTGVPGIARIVIEVSDGSESVSMAVEVLASTVAPPEAVSAAPSEASSPASDSSADEPAGEAVAAPALAQETAPQISATPLSDAVLAGVPPAFQASSAARTPDEVGTTTIGRVEIAPIHLGTTEVLSQLYAPTEVSGAPIAESEISRSMREARLEQVFSQLRDTVNDESRSTRQEVAVAIATGTSLTIGYVAWLIRGGVLVSSLLTSMPAWRLLDPLPILGNVKSRGSDDDDSLESMVSADKATPAKPKALTSEGSATSAASAQGAPR